ncbi:MAG: hypothetical protein JF588_03360 [Caulobacterales bacterium]|nr:hypothetical protein [Caulobacterales bacterium]
MTAARGKLETLVLAAFALATALLVLDRWTVTGLDPLAYGRIWQLFVNYADFGFTRRALVGTLLQMTGASRLFANEYYFAIFAQHLAIVALVIVTTAYFIRTKAQHSLLFKAVVYLSPAFILQSAYTTGSLDVFVVTIVAANVLLVRRLWLFSALLVLGVLVHELFLFTVPAQLIALYVRRDLDIVGRRGEALRTLGPPVAAAAIAALLIKLFGACHLSREQYEATMAALIPHAAHKIDLWSGYFEVSSSVDQNARTPGFLLRHLAEKFVYIAIPIGYLATLVALLVRQERGLIWKAALAGASLAPLVVYLVATDFYRWVGLSADMAILLLVTYADARGVQFGRAWLVAVLCFSLLAPFGGAVIENPFPAHKFLLQKLMGQGHGRGHEPVDAALQAPRNHLRMAGAAAAAPRADGARG